MKKRFGNFNLKLLLAIAALTISSCAKPNYQDLNNDLTNRTLTDSDCSLSYAQSDLCGQILWEKVPTESEMGSFLLKFHLQSSPKELIDPSYTVQVVLWMPSMGHGSSPVKIQKIETGVYRIYNVFFIMPGEWEIRIQLKDGANVIDQAVQKINI